MPQSKLVSCWRICAYLTLIITLVVESRTALRKSGRWEKVEVGLNTWQLLRSFLLLDLLNVKFIILLNLIASTIMLHDVQIALVFAHFVQVSPRLPRQMPYLEKVLFVLIDIKESLVALLMNVAVLIN